MRTSKSFLEAKKRGLVLTDAILSQDDMLTISDLAALLNVSENEIDKLIQENRLIALGSNRDKIRLPKWQIDEATRKPFSVIPDLFDVLGNSPWAVYRFLCQNHDEFNDANAIELIHNGESDLVLSLAKGVSLGDFS